MVKEQNKLSNNNSNNHHQQQQPKVNGTETSALVNAFLNTSSNLTTQMNFQQQQQQLLSTIFMYPSLFVQPPSTSVSLANTASTSAAAVSASSQLHLDQLLQRQLISTQQSNYLNNDLLATLTGGLLQQQNQQKQQQPIDMTLSNNIWAKLLTDMSSQLATNTTNSLLQQQQQSQQTPTLSLANNGEVFLKPPKNINQQPHQLNNNNNNNNNNNKPVKTQSNDKNGKSSVSNGNASSSKSQLNHSEFAIHNLINNNKIQPDKSKKAINLGHSQEKLNNNNNNILNHHNHQHQQQNHNQISSHRNHQQVKQNSNNTKSSLHQTKPTTSNTNQLGNSTSSLFDINNQNDALLMYATLLQQSNTNNLTPNQRNPFNNLFATNNNINSNNSFEWLLQLANQSQQVNTTKTTVNNTNNNSINDNSILNKSKQQTSHGKQSASKIESNTSNNNKNNIPNVDPIISTYPNQQSKQNQLDLINKHTKQNNEKEKIKPPINNNIGTMNSNNNNKNNFISSMDDQNLESIEAKIREPLKYGWRRETTIKEIHKNGIKGDVIYYSPCGKKLRTFQEIERYLTKNAKDMEEKDFRLTRENFTYSSKLIVGKFLQYKQLITHQHDDLENKSDEPIDNESKFNVLNEEDVINLITNINPKFRIHLNRLSIEQNSSNSYELICQTDKQQPQQQISPLAESNDHDLELKQKIESLKLLKKEQENLSRTQQAQLLEQQRLEQERLEQNLKLKLNDLQIDLKQDRISQQQEKQNRLLEEKRKEKYIQRERKTREKWFEHIVMREQNSRQNTVQPIESVDRPHIIFDSIDDMQEKYLKKMPDFKQLHSNESTESSGSDDDAFKLNWLGDCLQIIEFVNTFGPKLIESLNNKDTLSDDSDQFTSILSNLESFRSGLENRNDKFKREIVHLVQLLLKCTINTINDKSPSLNESNSSRTNEDNEGSLKHEIDANMIKEDDFYYMNNLKQLECNDVTYSELLRLFIKRSFYNLKQRREETAHKFNIDVTHELFENLKLYSASLEEKTFDQLEISLKAGIMAWLCDELLSTSFQSDEQTEDDNPATSCVVEDLDQTIEKLNELKHEKWLLESKCRQTKTEKLTASVNLTKLMKKSESNEEETPLNESDDKEKEKQKKLISQIDKKLSQFEKKRIQVKQTYDKCLNKLRSGTHLGQDRYLRHYWSLNHTGGLLIEAASKATIGSIYLSDNSTDLSPDVIKTENEPIEEDPEEQYTLKTYSHLVERISQDDPFKFVLKFNENDIINLTYRQIEYLVRNEIQQKKPENINKAYLTKSLESSSKWWLCDNEVIFKQLIECLAKRGYREKHLAKSLAKLNEENFSNSNSSVALTESTETNETTNSLFNRISNNLGNMQMFEKVIAFFKDYMSNDQSKQQRIVNQFKQNDYKDKSKVLKQMYALEDRVFKANLQQPSTNKDSDSNSDNLECPLEIAKSRLLELEARIERRYLKYPFAPRRKMTQIKFNSQTDNETKEETIDEEDQNLVESKPITVELERWRRLVKTCKTPSQMAILINQLNKLIEWEKSIMKVICQICNCDDNEDKLLLCDNCDKGNHTYCFKPVMDQIPDGDWYCYVCIGKLNNESLCCVCGSSEPSCPYTAENTQVPDLNKCDKCSKSFHGQCMPYARYFKTSHKWHCLNCQNVKPPASAFETNLMQNKRNLSAIHNLNKLAVKKRKKQDDSEDVSSKKGKKSKKLDQSSTSNNNKSKNKPNNSNENSSDENEEDNENNENECSNESENNGIVASDADTSKTSQQPKKRGRKKGSSAANLKAKKEKITIAAANKKQKLNESKTNPNCDKDLAMCANLLNELAKNENSWPFNEKVDPKQYPDYYDLIKEPMDIQTIRTKLKNKEYETKEDFAYDCRLIFDNCEFFNEDQSPIGKAGHKLRAFFETKWLRLFD